MSIEVDSANEHLKVDKISDDVYALAPNVILRFNVALSKISGGKRYHYHREYEYPSKNIQQSLVTIKRSFDYYLSFESPQKDEAGNKLFVRVGTQEYLALKEALDEVRAWYIDKKFSNLYIRSNGKLIVTSPIPESYVKDLPMQKHILFYPTVIDTGIANADKIHGVHMEFVGTNYSIDIDLNRFMGLYYIISCFNMYQAAITLINYNSKPPLGTNRYVMGTNNDHTLPIETSTTGPSGVIDRFVTPKGKGNISMLEG